MSRSVTVARAQLAARLRHHPEQDHSALRAELRALKLEQHVARTLAEFPPLTPEQRSRIAALLGGGGANA
ncbi:hypothetical protein GCM10009718_02630 [Isoptericola halotolerans]|uniref:Acetylornithine deacetylase/succinyl-diaminopimelate desuccinylase-like protein n=1 Tax=Isoptericola halotolerans TaxID=300560 RepID=A0ABX2A5E1_9MICO|nr:acetylornithine deacetylase/succinyl-diaminopimelate desuccinylase-like protein [Isoptericola halotolerans]